MKHWRDDTSWQSLGDVVTRLKERVEAAIRAGDGPAGAEAHDDLTEAEWRLRQAERSKSRAIRK